MIHYLKLVVITSVILAIIGYVFFQGYDLIRGPVLEIDTPIDNQSFEDSLIEIQGRAQNISFIYLNENQIFVDPEGYFAEKLLLLPGYNIITMRAKDKFNREVTRGLHLILINDGSQEES